MRSMTIPSLLAALLLASPAGAGTVKCTMSFDLSGWSFGYKRTSGEGKVTCSNGQSAAVTITGHSGGLTAAKSDLRNGKGTFTPVRNIDEIFGTYAQAEAVGKATTGGAARVMTKGEISLAITGQGRGWEAGAAVGSFTIQRK